MALKPKAQPKKGSFSYHNAQLVTVGKSLPLVPEKKLHPLMLRAPWNFITIFREPNFKH